MEITSVTDNIYDVGSTFLKQITTGKLKVNRSETIKLSYTLPLGKTASGKYVIIVIYADNTVVQAQVPFP